MAKAVKSKQDKSAKRPDAKKGDVRKGARRDEGRRSGGRIERARAQAKAVTRPGEKRGLSRFVHDVRVEMGKVTWPTRKDLTQSTIVVIIAVAISSVLILGYDQVFSRLVNLIIPK